ncbi:sulfite exporter TauE/SafE family protein [Pelagibacterium xiamenense]|uniref:sulfite exporter TauE/SafE family protein n=1 Tax=Pelagibacterium xiamenense TaxID=2901140 RepID=UPI001E5FB372|nr:sulfite exporter TauE/SafE family protein [Pelagibacterium xiamenense]MCD7058397.1 sulfite exporter TauE/SafE family protein [Pelagibacterium xiamenense]
MDFATLAIVFAAIGAGSISKGATGMGMPLIAIPFLASVFGLQHAVAVLVVPTLVTNLWQIWHFRAYRRDPRMRFLLPMLPAVVVGVAIGTWLLDSVPERGLTLALGLLLVGYVIFRLARPSFIVEGRGAYYGAYPAGLGAGVLHGATGISAPIGVTFIHAMRFERGPHVYAVSAMFLVLVCTQGPALWVAGIMQPEWVLQGTLALVPIAVCMPIGQWLASKLSARAFDRLILAFLGVIGLKMAVGL